MHHRSVSDCLPALLSPACADADNPGVLRVPESSVELSVERTFDGATVFITGARLHAILPIDVILELPEASLLPPSHHPLRPDWCLPAGATGFVGSVVLEQLLRVCPTVKKIYLLIRVKRGQSGAPASPEP